MRLVTTFLLIASTSALAAGPAMIAQRDRAFSARQIEVHQGDTIRFNNDDDFGHQVFSQSPSFSFDTDEVDPGNHVDVRFPTKGHFEVRCHIHPKMRLDVDVN